jgi:hypothetical protein
VRDATVGGPYRGPPFLENSNMTTDSAQPKANPITVAEAWKLLTETTDPIAYAEARNQLKEADEREMNAREYAPVSAVHNHPARHYRRYGGGLCRALKGGWFADGKAVEAGDVLRLRISDAAEAWSIGRVEFVTVVRSA